MGPVLQLGHSFCRGGHRGSKAPHTKPGRALQGKRTSAARGEGSPPPSSAGLPPGLARPSQWGLCPPPLKLHKKERPRQNQVASHKGVPETILLYE